MPFDTLFDNPISFLMYIGGNKSQVEAKIMDKKTCRKSCTWLEGIVERSLESDTPKVVSFR